MFGTITGVKIDGAISMGLVDQRHPASPQSSVDTGYPPQTFELSFRRFPRKHKKYCRHTVFLVIISYQTQKETTEKKLDQINSLYKCGNP